MSQEQNPFALTIDSACSLSANRPETHFAFIIEPLREVLSQHRALSDILQQLDALSVRFKRHYSDEFIDWKQRWDILTPFLDLLRDSDTPVISTTRSDLLEFDKLKSLATLHGQIKWNLNCKSLSWNVHLQSLGVRWNSLCFAVEECAGILEMQEKLVEYAKVSITTCCNN